MRIKTSITLPPDLLESIDHVAPNRSAFIERACRAYLARRERARRAAKDAKIINRNADRLNEEAWDVLEYQGLPLDEASFTEYTVSQVPERIGASPLPAQGAPGRGSVPSRARQQAVLQYVTELLKRRT